MNICESLTVAARLFPDSTAVTHLGRAYGYAELNARSAAAAAVLRQLGVERGDRVAVMLPNVPAFVVWYYAALRMGAIAVSISPRLADAEIAFIVEDSGAKALVGTGNLASALATAAPRDLHFLPTTPAGDAVDVDGERRSLPPQRQEEAATWVDAEPDEAAVILYTSGTTGFPKGATLSHHNVRSNVRAFNHLCNMQPDDRMLLAVPLFHCFGQNALLNSALNVGAHLILQNGFDLNESKRLIREHRVTQLYGVPMMFQLLHDHCDAEDLASVDYCFSAAATLPIQVSRQWREKFGMPIYEGYGLTETSPFASYNHRLRYVMGSIGTPIDGVEMKVVDLESGETCPPGELGEIAIRGPNVMLGYWNRPEDTAAAIRDGWFHSGDIGRVDAQGFLYIVDRVKDMIAVGGLKVYPAEVERTLMEHSLVAEAAVVGTPDAVFGERVIAFVVAKEGSGGKGSGGKGSGGKGSGGKGSGGEGSEGEEAETDGHNAALAASVMQFAKQRLGGYKVPQRFIVVEQLPRNPSGKILKTKLREQAQELASLEASASGDSVETLEAMEAPRAVLANRLRATHASDRQRVVATMIQELVRDMGELDELPAADAALLDLGLDSLMVVSLSERLQLELGPEPVLSATLVFDHPRINDLAQYMLSLLGGASSNAMDSKGSGDFGDSKAADNRAEPIATSSSISDVKGHGSDLRSEIEELTEEEALEALLKELDH